MAKITDIKFDINGVNFVVHVNCNSAGHFTANLPDEVATALRLEKKLLFTALAPLEKEIKDSIERFKKAETRQELFIAIKYLSAGRFSEKKDGLPLFGGHNNKYHLSIAFSNQNLSGLTFHFQVVIKETVDTAANWYETKLCKDFAPWDKDHQNNPDKYYKNGSFSRHSLNEWKMIPFSDTALDSLLNAQEKIRTVSEMLFKFIEQDEKAIELTLTNQKLLN